MKRDIMNCEASEGRETRGPTQGHIYTDGDKDTYIYILRGT